MVQGRNRDFDALTAASPVGEDVAGFSSGMKSLPGWVLAMVMMVASGAADGGEWMDAVTMEEVKSADVAAVILCQPDGSYRVSEELRGSGKPMGMLLYAMARLGIRHEEKRRRAFLYLHWQGTPLLEVMRRRRLAEVMNYMGPDGRPYVWMAGTGKDRYLFDYRVILAGEDRWKSNGSRGRW